MAPDGEEMTAFLADLHRRTRIERIAELMYVRFLVDMEDGRKFADVLLDMIEKEKGRGNG